MIASGTATDPIGVTASDTTAITVAGATGTRTIRRSLFENRVNWGSPTPGFEFTQGPTFGPLTTGYPSGPVSLSTSFQMLRDCEIVACRFYKAPLLAGTIPFALFDSAGTALASASLVCVADEGGWREIALGPAAVTLGAYYSVGYFVPNDNYAMSAWIWNAQDTVVYPFAVRGLNESGGLRTFGAGHHAGPAFVCPGVNERSATNWYIEPIAQWQDDLPGYRGGTSFYSQFENGGSSYAFPLAVYFADSENLAGYDAIGVNTLIAGSPSDEYIAAVKATGMDWYPTLYGGDMSAPVAVQEDPVLAARVRGYYLTDEPDLITPYNSPAAVRAWRDAARLRDSTRPIMLGLSYNPVKNQGYTAQPPTGTPLTWNQSWIDYAALADILQCDFYSLAASDSFSQTAGPGDPNRYGTWAYPPQIRRMAELNEARTPIWGVVETTSQLPGLPTPEDVRRACWALLIPGARGLVIFDHRFADADVTQDFAAALHNPAMSAMLTALSATLQSMSGALMAPEANLIESYQSTGTLAAAQGGYAQGARVPVLYSSRVVGGDSYLFAQAIRAGTTTVTFHVPTLPGAVLTVIGESRTVTLDGAGAFTDDFDDGDYTVRLYTTSATPVFTAPANTVAPALTGTATTGNALTCSTGTWTGVPTPTYSYQWQRAGVNIAGATSAAYTLQVADEGNAIRCAVTATNVAGTVSANSNTVTAAAAPPPSTVYRDAVLADTPAGYWRLGDLTDTSGNGLTLTASGTVTDQPSLLVGDGNGAKGFTFAGSSMLSASDIPALNPTVAIAFEAWVKPQSGQQSIMGKGAHHISLAASGNKFTVAFGISIGGVIDVASTSTWVAGQTYHVVGVYDGGALRLYINGVQDAIVTFATALAAQTGTPLTIGHSANPSYFTLDGTVDEVAVYGHALSAARVLAHYVAGTT